MTTTHNLIVEDTATRLFRVRDPDHADVAHVWIGIEVKRLHAGYVPRAKAREQLVRRAGCRVVAEVA